VGELFRQDRPKTALAWTGERLVTGIEGPIENEHLHRYLLAREFCRGKDVLDVASGEGYGAALLAQTARRVRRTAVALTDEAIEKIKSMIVSGTLRAGDRLPREADLAADLGLSRSSLREAVKALSLMNILDVRRGDGTYVTSLQPPLLLEALSFIVDFHRDGTVLASGSQDGAAILWTPLSESSRASTVRDTYCGIARRNLTRLEWREYLPGQSYHKTCPAWP